MKDQFLFWGGNDEGAESRRNGKLRSTRILIRIRMAAVVLVLPLAAAS